ncbi:hypothetical protein D9M72_528250 [compost metagenome]
MRWERVNMEYMNCSGSSESAYRWPTTSNHSIAFRAAFWMRATSTRRISSYVSRTAGIEWVVWPNLLNWFVSSIASSMASLVPEPIAK